MPFSSPPIWFVKFEPPLNVRMVGYFKLSRLKRKLNKWSFLVALLIPYTVLRLSLSVISNPETDIFNLDKLNNMKLCFD